MSFGRNLSYLRKLTHGMTQETLAEKLNVSRQTISKWEMDAAQPEMDKALQLCDLFSCTLDRLFREDLSAPDDAYTNLRVETVPSMRYISHIVISTMPEDDALDRVTAIAKQLNIENPKIIGWDFPCLSPEQTNVYHMHGYAAALILPEGVAPEGMEIHEQPAHKYAAIHIERPFDNPFVAIPGAYRTLMDYMRLNSLGHTEKGLIPCFETAGDTMDVYIACE